MNDIWLYYTIQQNMTKPEINQLASCITVKSIPPELCKFILRTQLEIKLKKGVGKYSQSQTIIYMLNEYSKITGNKK